MLIKLPFIVLLIFVSCGSNTTEPRDTPPTVDITRCDCPIDKISTHASGLDSSSIYSAKKGGQLSVSPSIEAAKKGIFSIGLKATYALPSRTDSIAKTIIKEYSSDFSNHDLLILEQQVYRSIYCALDNLICNSDSSTEEKTKQRKRNINEYQQKMKIILDKERIVDQKATTPAPKTNPIAKHKVQLKITINSDLQDSPVYVNGSLVYPSERLPNRLTVNVETNNNSFLFVVGTEAAKTIKVDGIFSDTTLNLVF